MIQLINIKNYKNIRLKYFLSNKKFLRAGMIMLILFAILLFFFVRNLFFHYLHQKKHRKNLYIPTSSFKRIIPNVINSKIIDSIVTTTGCGQKLSLTPGRSTLMVIKSDNKERRFLVYLPSSYNNSVKHPLILVFHGYNDIPSDMERFSGFDPLANTNNFIVVYPEGSPGLGGVLGWNTGLHPTIRGNDILFVSNMLNSLQANLCVNPYQIYASGFSNGGGFVGRLACIFSNRIAAFAPVSGSYLTLFSSCNTTRAVSIMEFHGNADNIVPYIGIPSLREVATFYWVSGWAKRDGCLTKPQETLESNLVTKYTWTGCRGNAEVIHYKIIGEKHTWPRVYFLESVNGSIKYIDTAHTIWNFFKRHPLPV